MRIGIIGAGNIGGTLARHFIRAGHEVGLSNSRGRASLEPLVKSLGPLAHAMTTEEAARFGELVVLATPWRTPEALPAANLVSGKVVIDTMNPYGADGEIIDLGTDTSSEHVARRLPGARLVKAFNTMFYRTLATEARSGSSSNPRPDTRSGETVISERATPATAGRPLPKGEGRLRGNGLAGSTQGAPVGAGEGPPSNSPNLQKPAGLSPNRLVLFVAGDDLEAKQVVSRLIEEIGFAALDTGSLREGGRRQQPGSPIYNRPMTLDEAREILKLHAKP